MLQASLFARPGPPGFDPTFTGARRRELAGGAWVDVVPAWISGHLTLFDQLRECVAWRHGSRDMYGRIVDVPRLLARFPDDGEPPPVLLAMERALSARYGRDLGSLSLALYRDGRDSVAWHGDRMGELVQDCIVAVASVGERRLFLLRPRGGGRSLRLSTGAGDLIVLGGSCQATWEHCVPKCEVAGPRIAVMFRQVSGSATR